jgi:WW domain-binding protein 4
VTKPPRPSDPWANYTTAASLGYTDPDEERMKAEADRRRSQGVAGEWEVVEQSMSAKPSDTADTASEPQKKREAEEPPDSEDTRSFKLRKKVAPSVVDDWDADLVPVKLKPKKVEVLEPAEGVKKEEPSQLTGVAPIKWTSRGWKRPEDEPDGGPSPSTLKDEEVNANLAAIPEPIATVSESEVKEEPTVKVEPPAEAEGETGVVFRKRKLGGNRGKR